MRGDVCFLHYPYCSSAVSSIREIANDVESKINIEKPIVNIEKSIVKVEEPIVKLEGSIVSITEEPSKEVTYLLSSANHSANEVSVSCSRKECNCTVSGNRLFIFLAKSITMFSLVG